MAMGEQGSAKDLNIVGLYTAHSQDLYVPRRLAGPTIFIGMPESSSSADHFLGHPFTTLLPFMLHLP